MRAYNVFYHLISYHFFITNNAKNEMQMLGIRRATNLSISKVLANVKPLKF